jgi:PIN domain nuclease of toxin-antitoxin system
VRLLLDTHALIWALSAPKNLPDAVARRLSDPSTVVFASAASTWEIAIKAALGKIDADLDEIIGGIRETGFTPLSITVEHTRRLSELPHHHRDPFDRILVAQALEDGLTVVTHDAILRSYPAPILWS